MKKKIFVFGMASILFILIFPVIRMKIEEQSTNICELVIETTGTHNPKSNGTEVWIDGINVDGNDIDLSAIELAQGWELNGRIFSKGDTQYYLKIELPYKECLQIRFIKHPYSGIVNVIYGDKKNIIDLFAEQEMIDIYKIE